MSDLLTPRVGDRVLIKSPAYGDGKTHVGTIRNLSA